MANSEKNIKSITYKPPIMHRTGKYEPRAERKRGCVLVVNSNPAVGRKIVILLYASSALGGGDIERCSTGNSLRVCALSPSLSISCRPFPFLCSLSLFFFARNSQSDWWISPGRVGSRRKEETEKDRTLWKARKCGAEVQWASISLQLRIYRKCHICTPDYEIIAVWNARSNLTFDWI